MLVKKTFTIKETKVIQVKKEVEVFNNGTLLKCIKQYNEFRIGEIILIHSSFCHDHAADNVAYKVCWWFKNSNYSSSKKLQSVERDVSIIKENFIECKFKDLQSYINT